MKKIKTKKFILFFTFLILASADFCLALEVKYPQIGTTAPITQNSSLTEYLKYIFDAGMFIGFLSVTIALVWAGVLYLWSGVSPDSISKAKDKISGAISGLLILLTIYLIITTINPELKFFRLEPLPPAPAVSGPPPTPGVYFYKNQCKDNPEIKTGNVPDFGEKNKINSVKIIQDFPDNAYITILYDFVNLWGKCQYISSGDTCENAKIPNGVASASVRRYDFSPSGDGVYFYRKSFFNENGGWTKITNSQINDGDSVYSEFLDNLSFVDSSGECTVPEKEQNCIKWNELGECKEKQCPNLGGKNISSIKINGNYVVVLIYLDQEKDAEDGPWSFCQEFSADSDANKDGPEQIKWDHIENTEKLPNQILIFPVKDK